MRRIFALLLMLTLLLMTPTVFFAIQRLFDWGEKIFRRVFRSTFRKSPPEIPHGLPHADGRMSSSA